MATEKNISSRIIHKHDIEANWNKATNFIPKAGEIIIYDKDETYDYERFKIGDGQVKINDLSFTSLSWNALEDKPFSKEIVYISETVASNIPKTTVSNGNVVISGYGIYPGKDAQYIVIFDNIEYELSVVLIGSGGDAIGYLGNLSLCEAGEDNGLPFCIQQPRMSSKCYIYTSDKEIHTIQAIYGYYDINFLNERFIPNTIARTSDLVQSDWNQTDETALDFIKNKPDIATDDEIIEMLTQEDMFPVVTDADGSILSDENNNILLW